VASLSQGRTAAAQCGLFTYKSVPVIFEPPCILMVYSYDVKWTKHETDYWLSPKIKFKNECSCQH